MPSHTCCHYVYDIYAKISVYEIKNGTLNAPLIFLHQIMLRTTANYIHTNTGKTGDIAVKYVIFINVYTTSLQKIIVSPASIFVGEWLQRQYHFWA